MKEQNITIDYDNDADVVYIPFGKPREAVTEEMGNISVNVDEKTHEFVGLTVMNFMLNMKKKHEPIKVRV